MAPSNYPANYDIFNNPTDDVPRRPGYELDVLVSNLGDAVEALEHKLGTGASSPVVPSVLHAISTGIGLGADPERRYRSRPDHDHPAPGWRRHVEQDRRRRHPNQDIADAQITGAKVARPFAQRPDIASRSLSGNDHIALGSDHGGRAGGRRRDGEQRRHRCDRRVDRYWRGRAHPRDELRDHDDRRPACCCWGRSPSLSIRRARRRSSATRSTARAAPR